MSDLFLLRNSVKRYERARDYWLTAKSAKYKDIDELDDESKKLAGDLRLRAVKVAILFNEALVDEKLPTVFLGQEYQKLLLGFLKFAVVKGDKHPDTQKAGCDLSDLISLNSDALKEIDYSAFA